MALPKTIDKYCSSAKSHLVARLAHKLPTEDIGDSIFVVPKPYKEKQLEECFTEMNLVASKTQGYFDNVQFDLFRISTCTKIQYEILQSSDAVYGILTCRKLLLTYAIDFSP